MAPLLLALAVSLAHVVPAAPSGRAHTTRKLVLLIDQATLPKEAGQDLLIELKREVDKSANYTWQDPPPLSFEELLLALSCRKLDDKCVQRVGPMLKVDTVILVSGARGKKKDVQLLMAEAKGNRRMTVPVTPGLSMAPALSQALRKMLGAIRPPGLNIVTEPPGALVTLDGIPKGTSPVEITDIALGKHRVEVVLFGHESQGLDVEAMEGEAREIRFTLLPDSVTGQSGTKDLTASGTGPKPAPEEPKPDPTLHAHTPSAGLFPPLKWGLLGMGGLGVTISGVGLALGLGMLTASGAVYGLVWNVQSAIKIGNPLVYPLGFGGTGAAALALFLAPWGAAVVIGALMVDVALRLRE